MSQETGHKTQKKTKTKNEKQTKALSLKIALSFLFLYFTPSSVCLYVFSVSCSLQFHIYKTTLCFLK